MVKLTPAAASPPPPDQAWGTWEELLLACAVHRYGADRWESVATEVQRRSTSLKSLTALSCKRKYRDLSRRFCCAGDGVSRPTDRETTGDGRKVDRFSVPAPVLLDELRQLRVDELRREVQRYDLSIMSLQSKVERLKEERDRKEELVLTDPSEKPEERETASLADDSDGENRSVNESNSTDPKSSQEPPTLSDKKQSTPASIPGYSGEGSADDESIAQSRDDLVKDDGVRNPKESSEGESSQRQKIEEQVSEGQPLSTSNGDSRPLFDILDNVQSHKHSSFFLRRLESQETCIDHSLVRQHMDLETVRMRLNRGEYCGCRKKFFRDLLIIFNNAIVFFNRTSVERIAALELREVVTRKMAETTSSVEEHPTELGEQERDPGMRVMMITCRKRSANPTKAATVFSGWDRSAASIDDSTRQEEPVGKSESPRSKMGKKRGGRRKKESDRPPKTVLAENVESKSNSSLQRKDTARRGGSFSVSDEVLLESSNPGGGALNRSKRGEVRNVKGKDEFKKEESAEGKKQDVQQVNRPKKGRPPNKRTAEVDSSAATKKRNRR